MKAGTSRHIVAILMALTTVAVFAEDDPYQKLRESSFVPHIAYPQVAIAARVEGTVTVRIVVKEGKVTDCSAESGPPMLQPAAVAAAKDGWFDTGPSGTYLLNFHFELLDRNKPDDWKKPQKVEWLLPEITIVRRKMIPGYTTTDLPR